jgi:hypothetical protein
MVSGTWPVVMVSVTGKWAPLVRFPSLVPVMVSRHWTFIFWPLAGSSSGVATLPGCLCNGFGLFEGFDTPPVVRHALVGTRMATGQAIQRWLPVASVAGAALASNFDKSSATSSPIAGPIA